MMSNIHIIENHLPLDDFHYESSSKEDYFELEYNHQVNKSI